MQVPGAGKSFDLVGNPLAPVAVESSGVVVDSAKQSRKHAMLFICLCEKLDECSAVCGALANYHGVGRFAFAKRLANQNESDQKTK